MFLRCGAIEQAEAVQHGVIELLLRMGEAAGSGVKSAKSGILACQVRSRSFVAGCDEAVCHVLPERCVTPLSDVVHVDEVAEVIDLARRKSIVALAVVRRAVRDGNW